MTIRFLALSSAFAASLLLSSCVSGPRDGGLSNETVGTIGGAATGAVIGGSIARNGPAGAVLGAAVGGLIGNRVGHNVDEDTRQRYWDAQNRALDEGSTEEWSNDGRGDHGRFAAGRPYYQGATLCRGYDSEAWIDGQGQTRSGRACRNPDGSWTQM